MKSGSKVLIGVLSVAALVGTGVATWTVGGGYHEKETVTITPEIATIGSRDVDLDVVIDAEEGDHPIRFDNPTLQDLRVTYHVTGKKGADAADDFDPFTYNYSTVASEYQPNLSWETTVYRDGSPVGKDDAFFDYVVAPKGEMKYSDWLISDGIDVTLIFEWSEKILGGLNPQTYIDQHIAQYPTKDAQTEFFTKLNEALDVTFKFTFKVGGLTETPIETPTTGEVTLPTVENSTLLIEGMTDNTIPAGEHTITITTNEGYVLTDNKLSVIENGETKEVTMTENSLTRAASHTYTRKYDFKENATYKFSYAVEEETVVTPVEKYAVTFNQPENGTITVTSGETSLTSGALVDENTEVTYIVIPSEGYHIASVTVNDIPVEATFDGAYTGKVTVTSATSISATMEADAVEPVVEYTTIKEIADIAHTTQDFTEVTIRGVVGAELKSGSGLVIYDGTGSIQLYDRALTITEYPLGTKVSVTGTPEIYKPGQYGNNRYQFSYNSMEVTKIEDDTFNPQLIKTNLLDLLNEENFELTDLEGKYFTVTVQPFTDGDFTNFNIFGNNDYIISLNSSALNEASLDQSKYYELTGFFSYVSSNRITLFGQSIQETTPEYSPVESVSITNTNTELEVGESLQLTSEVLPETANQEVTYEVTSGSEYAEVSDTGLVTAKAEGEVTITVTTKGLNASEQAATDTITLNIKAATTEIPVTTTYELTVENLEINATSYNDGNGTKNIDGVDFSYVQTIKGTGENTGSIQTRVKNLDKSGIWNSTAFNGRISKIEIVPFTTWTSTNPIFYLSLSNSEISETQSSGIANLTLSNLTYEIPGNETYTYFRLDRGGSSAAYIEKIIITVVQ